MLKNTLSLLILLSTPTLAYDCDSQPDDVVFKVGQISPKKIKKILKDNDYSIEPNLLEITTNKELINEALELGLKIQKLGNESNVYHVDGLVYMVQGNRDDAQPKKAAVYALMQKALKSSSYMSRFQMMHGARLLAMLRLMDRNEEADQLQAHLNSKKFDSNAVHSMALLLSNTGRFQNHKDSVELCERIKKLPI